MNTSSAKIQKTQILEKQVANKGIPANDIRTVKCAFEGDEKKDFNQELLEFAKPYMAYYASIAEVNEVDDCGESTEEEKRASLLAGWTRNILNFDMMSASGHTDNLLKKIKQDKRFVDCFPKAGESTTSGSNSVKVDLKAIKK